MKMNGESNMFETFARALLAAFLISAAASPASLARTRKPALPSVGVIAHVVLPEGPVTRMLLVEKNGKQYLYVGLASPAALSVIEVSKPAQARIIEGAAGPGGTPTGDLRLVGNTLALLATSQPGTVRAESSDRAPQSVTILNVDDPSKPQELRSFSGVTSLLTDEARGLIYVANNEGLWIVKAKQKPVGEEPYPYAYMD
jgi:hypothetical protein